MKLGLFSAFHIRGFTLVELSISLAIMGMMMALLLYNYPETAIRMTLTNTNRTTSLLVREAQIRGSAIDSGDTSLVESPIGGYGVYANLASSSKLVLFADFTDVSVPKPYGLTVGNGFYENIGIDETKSITNFPQGYTIAKLCIWSNNKFICNSDYTPVIQTLTISFTRPSPQPSIYINDALPSFTAGCIELHSPRGPIVGHVRSVQVFNSGMIRTQVGPCDNS